MTVSPGIRSSDHVHAGVWVLGNFPIFFTPVEVYAHVVPIIMPRDSSDSVLAAAITRVLAAAATAGSSARSDEELLRLALNGTGATSAGRGGAGTLTLAVLAIEALRAGEIADWRPDKQLPHNLLVLPTT